MCWTSSTILRCHLFCVCHKIAYSTPGDDKDSGEKKERRQLYSDGLLRSDERHQRGERSPGRWPFSHAAIANDREKQKKKDQKSGDLPPPSTGSPKVKRRKRDKNVRTLELHVYEACSTYFVFNKPSRPNENCTMMFLWPKIYRG